MTAVVRLAVSPREYRLVVERLLQYAGLDRGIVVPLRETVLDAELATGAALRYVLDHADRIAACAPDAIGVTVRDGVLDAAGRPAVLLAPAVLDALRTRSSLVVAQPHGAELLAGLAISAVRYRLDVHVDVREDGVTVTTRRDSSAPQRSAAEELAGGAHRLRAMTEGIAVDEQLWWTAYRRSNLALSVDTKQSRRHAGATIVEADGTVRGAVDDEIDPTVYNGERAALFDESSKEHERQ